MFSPSPKMLLPILLSPALIVGSSFYETRTRAVEDRLDKVKWAKKKCVTPGCDNDAAPGKCCCSVECYKKLKTK